MKKRHLFIPLILLIVLFGLYALVSAIKPEQTSANSLSHANHSNFRQNMQATGAPLSQKVEQVYLPQQMTFAGENVPLDDYQVYESIDRELTLLSYYHSSTIRIIKLSHRWFPVIEEILEKNGVPKDFKYLAAAESGLQNVISPKSARGFWQFLKDTGRSYGLEVSKDVDERYHIEKSTEAACKYFKQAHKKFGDWTTAAASYNMGMGGINKQMTNQKQAHYYDLYLNSETARYVYRILAYKLLLEHPEKYGYQFQESDLYPRLNYEIVEVDSIKNIANFAQRHNTTYKHIKLLNQWLIGTSLSLKKKPKKTYEIKVPK